MVPPSNATTPVVAAKSAEYVALRAVNTITAAIQIVADLLVTRAG